jgi:putative endonuclease
VRDCSGENLTSRHGRACPGHPRLGQAEKLYLGVTSDPPRRAWEHRTGAVKGFTSRYGLKRLVWYEFHEEIYLAIQREHTMKHWPRAWKVRLILGTNPDWQDLYETLNS